MNGSAAPAIAAEFLPALSLVGFTWEGSYEEAATGVIGELMSSLRRTLSLPDDARLFGVSWLERPDGFRHFCGIAAAAAPGAAGLPAIDLPALACLTTLHPGGDATAGYARLMEERDRRGLAPSAGVGMVDEHLGTRGGMRLWLPYA